MRRHSISPVVVLLAVGCSDEPLNDEPLFGPVMSPMASPTAEVNVPRAPLRASEGTSDVAVATSSIEDGVQMFWDPVKKAFRAGRAEGTQWDDGNVGEASFATGSNTTASGDYSTALGNFTTASGDFSTAMGAETTASGDYSTAMGAGTTASGDYSTAMGSYASTNSKVGAFVYGDLSITEDVNAPEDHSFTVRAVGGTTFYSHPFLFTGVTLAPGDGAWASVSDRNLKENFRDADGEATLSAIAAMSIQSWNYKTQDPSIRHLGPMAQDVYAAFGLGLDDKHINTVDIDGINMLGVQALEKRTSELRAENEQLRATVNALTEAVVQLEAAVAGMRER